MQYCLYSSYQLQYITTSLSIDCFSVTLLELNLIRHIERLRFCLEYERLCNIEIRAVGLFWGQFQKWLGCRCSTKVINGEYLGGSLSIQGAVVSSSSCVLTESHQEGLHLGFGVKVFVMLTNGRRLEDLPWFFGTQTVGKLFGIKDLNNAENNGLPNPNWWVPHVANTFVQTLELTGLV